MISLTGDYLLYTFVSCLGVIQAAVSYSRIRGLCFFKRPIFGYLFALITVSASSAWFFTAENRNLKGLEGSQQFRYFITTCGTALVVTALLSSVINHRMKSSITPSGAPSKPGLGTLTHMTYIQAIKNCLRKNRSEHDSQG